VEGRLREAARLVPLERLALSPQCGFASGEAGNPLTPTQQAAPQYAAKRSSNSPT
jgi:5-methyltetrahydropteroyltriglutamate--homocysteine methyltransferase